MKSEEVQQTTESRRPPWRDSTLLWLATGCLAMLVGMACVITIAAAGIIAISQSQRSASEQETLSVLTATSTVPPLPTHVAPLAVASPSPTQSANNEAEPDSGVATETIPTATLTPEFQAPAEIQPGAPPDSAFQHLSAMLAAEYPARDYFETASRLGRTEVGNRTVEAQHYQVGDRRSFNTDDGLRETILLAVSENAYFWVESTLNYDQSRVEEAARRFEDDYFPPVAKLYGLGWQNGVDDDPKFSVLHLDGYAEGTELGFFNSGDQYPRSVNTSSNEQEVIYLNMENMRLGEPLYFGTLVHELQHLIQWHYDPNEPVWLSEGLAQFTELYVGLDTVDTAPDYLRTPGTRLNTWLHDAGDEIFAHYGAAYLFVVYFWEQYGDQAIQELMRHPADGLAGFDAVLAKVDPERSLDQLVLDWATANYLDGDANVPGYSYDHLSLNPPDPTASVDQLPYETVQEIEQFAVSYVDLDVSGQHTLAFAGNAMAELLPSAPYSGGNMWFVPALNELDAQLTAYFDLTGLSQATLDFWAWYELENGYDFAYVSASADGGATWELLMPTHAAAGEFGPALTGRSDRIKGNQAGWVKEAVSLTAYAGGPVLIRFEVLSDSAVAESGFAIDDIAIPELGYVDDIETGTGSWQALGFVRTGHQLPQIWRLNLILRGDTPQIIPLDLDNGGQGHWTVDIGQQGAGLVITAQTPFVSESTSYWLAINPAG